MAERGIEQQASGPIPPPRDKSDISEELFGAYKKEYIQERSEIKEETKWSLEGLKRAIGLSKPKPPEKPKEPLYDPLKLSIMGKKFLDTNHEKLKLENPDTTTILIYQQGTDMKKSEARYFSIPRTNPENRPIKVNGFTLAPSPKSNGYNTEYIITGPDGKEWTQLAVFFPATNPKFTQKHELEVRLIARKQSLAARKAELAQIKPTKKNVERRADIQRVISQLGTDITGLTQKIASSGNPEQFTHFSYVPFREGLDTKENQSAGYSYLASTMKHMYKYVPEGSKKTVGSIKSNASGLPIEEALPWQYPLILNIVERMDFEDYFDSATKKVLLPKSETDPMMLRQIGRSLTTFGVNKEHAFNWQRSKVGAQGVGQIMPSTYRRFAQDEKYGAFFPEEDFDIASRDHETSFRLQISHFDDQIFQFPIAIKKNWKALISDPSTQVGIIAILAAGYNGSMKRIVDEVFGDKNLSLEDCRKMLSLNVITTSMKDAKDYDIREIEKESIQKPHKDKKTKKMIQPPPLPLNADQRARIHRRMAMYKESMTYVLKADFVWKHLKGEFKGQF